jgi:hypothetical protein
LRLQRRGVITLVTAPGDGEVTVVTDETMGEKAPLLARLLAAATAGGPPAGDYCVLAQRKPTSLRQVSGQLSTQRMVLRSPSGGVLHEPPRNMRPTPVVVLA